jgi:predicted O-methyltransferase YrrM
MAKVRNPLPMTVNWEGLDRRELYLEKLVKDNGWTVGIEVGVRTGRTVFHLLNTCSTLKMYAVDKDISQFYSEEIQSKYEDRLVVLEGTSWEQNKKILEKVDFVFIDAGHATKAVVNDINAFRPLLKSDQGLLGHDADFPAIQQALDQLGITYDVGPDQVWSFK